MNAKDACSSTTTLIVFCRRPALGAGKRRIAATIGPVLTLELATRLLDTTLEDAASWPGPVVIAPADNADGEWAGTLLDGSQTVCAQPEGNLGERINAVDRTIRSSGGEQLMYIGSDAPILDEAYLVQARAALISHDVVLGGATDGGVVLMGSRCAWPELASLPWSGNDLGAKLELLCTRRGLTVKRLPALYDIDNASDLPLLHTDLSADLRPARRALRDWLSVAGLAPENLT